MSENHFAMRRFLPGLGVVAAVALAGPWPSGAAPGQLTQLRGKGGCASTSRIPGCARGVGMYSPVALAASPDGRNVYVASAPGGRSNGSLAVFRRDPVNGAVHQLRGKSGCLNRDGTDGCGQQLSLVSVTGVVIAPDGKTAYVAGNSFGSRAGLNGIEVLRRDSNTGVLERLPGPQGCFADHYPVCTHVRGLSDVAGLAISPDGRNLYATSVGDESIVVLRAEAPGSALVQLPGSAGCLSRTMRDGCGVVSNLRPSALGASSLAVSPDGRFVYAGLYIGAEDAGVMVLARDTGNGAIAPVGPTARCSLAPGSACQRIRSPGSAYQPRLGLSPDGRSLYVGSEWPFVAIFTRDPQTGGLRQPAGASGCLNGTGCRSVRGFAGETEPVVSPDGANVYVADRTSIATLNRELGTGALSQSPPTCVRADGRNGCVRARALRMPGVVALSPDGRNLYAAGARAHVGSLVVFRRASAPTDKAAGVAPRFEPDPASLTRSVGFGVRLR